MELKIIGPNDSILDEIMSLGKKNAKTLGMFPEGAFIDHAKKKCIVAAIENGELCGYILFRITQKKGIISIAHLCVDAVHRNKGTAKKLLDYVKNKYQQIFRGISLSCRKDYIEASRFYEKNGFKAAKVVRSRSKGENYLVKWFFDFGNQDLFSTTHISETKFNVLLDANILIKLRDLNEDFFDEIEALTADWLVDEVEYFYAQEMLNEINRDTNKGRASLTRNFVNRFKEARFIPNERDQIIKEISVFLGGMTPNDISDKNQLAECIASHIDCFVTGDKNILSYSDKIFESYSIKVLSPSELILHIDQLKNKQNYNSVRLAGANYLSSTIGAADINQLTKLFISKEHDEKKHELEQKISLVISKIEKSYLKVVKNNKNEFIGFIAGYSTENSIVISLIRTTKDKISYILFYQLVTDVINYACKSDINKIIIDDKYLRDYQKEIIESFQFELTNGQYQKLSIKGLISTSDFFENETIKRNNIDMSFFKEKIDSVNEEERELLKLQLERKFWPLKLKDLNIPTYIVPIKRHWASQLFDDLQANQTLFGAKAELVWQKENVYYRNVNPVTEVAPARILWYVSLEKKVTTGRHKGIIACSYLDEVSVGTAKTLFEVNKNYGIYEWKDIYKLADENSSKEIKAIKFSDTEVFNKIISLEKVTEILNNNDRSRNTFTSPLRVSKEIFNQIYEIGKEL